MNPKRRYPLERRNKQIWISDDNMDYSSFDLAYDEDGAFPIKYKILEKETHKKVVLAAAAGEENWFPRINGKDGFLAMNPVIHFGSPDVMVSKAISLLGRRFPTKRQRIVGVRIHIYSDQKSITKSKNGLALTYLEKEYRSRYVHQITCGEVGEESIQYNHEEIIEELFRKGVMAIVIELSIKRENWRGSIPKDPVGAFWVEYLERQTMPYDESTRAGLAERCIEKDQRIGEKISYWIGRKEKEAGKK